MVHGPLAHSFVSAHVSPAALRRAVSSEAVPDPIVHAVINATASSPQKRTSRIIYLYGYARLEIDDVELADEGHVKVPGKYTVFKGSTVVAQDLPTKTGLDLPPGHYTVATFFTRPSGQSDLLTQEVDL